MTVTQLSSRVQRPRSWTLTLPCRPGANGSFPPEDMNASELMFFFGAPLAHVVRYESHLREMRHTKTVRHLARTRKARDFTSGMATLAPAPRAAGAGG